MHIGKGQVVETLLEDGVRLARISCPANLIPSAGQYLLASAASDAPLPVPLFHTDSAPEGFITALPETESWNPGQRLFLRGPLGHGFAVPISARKVALIAFDSSPVRLRGLIQPCLTQGAAVVLVGNFFVEHLPNAVEVQPLTALPDILIWADYMAFDVARENLFELRERLGALKQLLALEEARVLIRTPVTCGGVAECGVCAVSLKFGWKLACKDGPVFERQEL
jgi:NAD(P)H-flavin reductase